MKTAAKIFVVIIVLAAIIEGFKPTGTDRQEGAEERIVAPVIDRTYSDPGVYDAGFDLVQYPCPMCDGEGRIECRVCHGSGENELYDQLSPVMKGFSKPYCEGCDGRGWIECGRCHGTGMD